MPSLCSYDKNKKEFYGRKYRDDINSHLDFQERLFHEIKKRKKRLPLTIALTGNHDNRINRAVSLQGELEGTIAIEDLELEKNYDVVVGYDGSTPGIVNVAGVNFAHYVVSGIMGRPLSSENPAASLLSKKHISCVVGHSHLMDFSCRTRLDDTKIMAAHAGCFIDYDPEWCGNTGKLWDRGCLILHSTEDGQFDLQTVSMNSLKKAYGRL